MKFRLTAPHIYQDQYLEEGVEIGTDTAYPIYEGYVPPSCVEPLNDEATEFIARMASDKPHWGRPEEALKIVPDAEPGVMAGAGDYHPVTKSPQANQQPIIPPPLEHLTRPNDLKPGEPSRVDPRLAEALAADNDRRMAEEANRQAAAKTGTPVPKMTPANLPGQGPAPKPPSAPGQGPAPKQPVTKAEDVKPPKPTGNTPRNTAGLVPENPDGEFKDLSKKDESDKK